MTNTAPLPTSLCRRILLHFGMRPQPPPTLETLQLLVARYTRIVPWESASRIARRARHESAADCAVLGAAFWQSHFDTGSGGTCYESNYAFWGLLRRLGYAGYLTINDMGENVGCHSAIVVWLDGQKWLVDVGLPLYAALPIPVSGASETDSPFFRYTMQAQTINRYAILREPHPQRDAFQLVDEPVADEMYRRATVRDYQPKTGLFLQEVVINKVVDEQLWRFHSDVRPLCLQQFVAGERQDQKLGDDPAAELAAKFGMSRDMLVEAMVILGAAC